MKDDETFRNMPSLAPSDPPSRSDEIDHQFRHLSYKLDELIGIVSQLNRDEGNSKLDDLMEKVDFSRSQVIECVIRKGDYVINMQEIDFGHLNEKLDAIDTKLDHLDNRLDGLDTSLALLIKMCLNGSFLIFVFLLLSSNTSWWFAAPLLAIYGWHFYRINKEL